MNELIEDLMHKADEVKVPENEDFCDTDFLADMDPRRVEIFAKLIIKEIDSLSFRGTGHVTSDGEDSIKTLICNHFGVE